MGVLKGGLFGFNLVFGWNEFDWPYQSKAYLIKTENSNWVYGQKFFGGQIWAKSRLAWFGDLVWAPGGAVELRCLW
jgi:hypothetical protein